MVPEGYEFSFSHRDYESGKVFLVFNKYTTLDKMKSFALDKYGKPANGRLAYGIPEGALITYNFEIGHQVGNVIIDD